MYVRVCTKLQMTSLEGASKLQTPGNKSQLKPDCSAGEKDVFREIPLRYAGKYYEIITKLYNCRNYSIIFCHSSVSTLSY